mgnify:CR=1 FL=1
MPVAGLDLAEEIQALKRERNAVIIGRPEYTDAARALIPDDGLVVVLSGDVPLIADSTLTRLTRACDGQKLALLTVCPPDPTGYGRIVLAKAPGVLVIDTGGIAGKASVAGGAPVPVPGRVTAPAGAQELVVRAAKYRDAVVRLQVEGDGTGTTLRGTLVYLSPVVDAASGLLRIKAEFENPEGRLRPGVSARLMAP